MLFTDRYCLQLVDQEIMILLSIFLVLKNLIFQKKIFPYSFHKICITKNYEIYNVYNFLVLFIIIYRTILHEACLSGNKNLVEILIKTDKFNLADEDILLFNFYNILKNIIIMFEYTI